MIYTGGTTGMPKGVMWRQEDIFYALCGGIDAYTQREARPTRRRCAKVPTASAARRDASRWRR